MRLHWEGNNSHQSLFAGDNPTELAWLEKRKKYWSAVVWLPDISPAKRYAPLEEHQRDIERQVLAWFELAVRE